MLQCDKNKLMFFKYSLGMHITAPNIAIAGDTGTYPLYIKTITAMIKYAKRMQDPKAPTIIKNAWQEQNALHVDGHPCWLTNYNKYADQLKELDIDVTIDSPDLIKHELKDTYIKWWETQINNQTGEGFKLRTYAGFKQEFGFENYLDSTNIAVRNITAKFRASHHKLHIETDRHIRNVPIPPEKRYCQMCNLRTMEDDNFKQSMGCRPWGLGG